MVRVWVVFVGLSLALLFGMASVEARVSLESFAADTEMGYPKISPNGRYLAVPMRKGGAKIIIIDLEAPPDTKSGFLAVPDNLVADWVEWGNDDRLLINLTRERSIRFRGRTYDASVSRVISIDRTGTGLVVLFANKRSFRNNLDLSEVVHPLPDDPKSVLMGADKGGRYNLFRVNIYDGTAEQIQAGSTNTFGWLTDLDGVPRVRWDYRPRQDRIEIYLRKGDTDTWDMVTQYGERELPELNIVGFADDPRQAIVASRQTSDRYGLYEYDVTTHKLGRSLFQNAKVDVGEPVGGPMYDPRTTKLVGYYYVDDFWTMHYLEPDLSRIQQKLDATFPQAAIVRIYSWSTDRSRFLFVTQGPRDPGSFYLYDAKKDEAKLVGRLNSDIPESELGPMSILKFAARDGTKIQAYVTMPPGQAQKKLPTIMMPHGGPELRDFVDYDHWAQMLANRGYLVAQPNFRGSGGYGKAFAEAGHRQWGRKMQDDISDTLKALIDEGLTDPDRVCIVGGSYGGYAALAGGAFTPDLYKCVVAIAGVSDIPAFLEEEEDTFGDDSSVYQYWVKRLGDPARDLEQMKSVSPALNAASFKVPVLLIHGSADRIVPIDQSNRMRKALEKAGKEVRFVEIKGEGHNFTEYASDLRLMQEMEQFVNAHIGN